jgi:hypothetical protein
MSENYFIDLFKLGLMPIPLIWNTEKKSADSHYISHSEITAETYNETTFGTVIKNLHNANGMAIKLFPPFGCIDFDLKNTEDKTVFNTWKKAVASLDDSIFDKICIETTRNGGYHVYIKYSKLQSKVSLAREEKGEEVIAIYTGGTLAYCDPTPGYKMIHNEFNDLDELTADQFDVLTSCCASFDKYKPELNSQKNDIIQSYPLEYESLCFQFDRKCTDEIFTHLLNSIGLVFAPDYKLKKNDKFQPVLRVGSKATYSGKAYYSTKNLQLFTSSIAGFPCFNDRVNKDDTSWNLSPTKIIFYKNDKDWILTVEEIILLCESAGIEIVSQQPVTNQPLIKEDRLKFPFDIFPDPILNFIKGQFIQHEYLGGFALGVVSTLIGNSCKLKANAGYIVKPILYMTVVAPPGASKTPAMKAMYKPLEMIDDVFYTRYENEKKQYQIELSDYKNQKKGDNIKEPKKPVLNQMLIKDSTIEMLIKILAFNKQGCCLYADEFAGFMKRMNRYGDGDELQKWLELWSGSPVLMQRIGRDEDKVQNPFCTIVGGIQPGVLDILSSYANEHNGFFHRFLFLYPEPQYKADWTQYDFPQHLTSAYYELIDTINSFRDADRLYNLSAEANSLYGEWFNNKNRKYNATQSDQVKGIIAKYQDYCLRFSLIIEVMNNPNSFSNTISSQSMERAIRLTEYFLGNMNKAMKILTPVTPIDKLTGINEKFYNSLPEQFSALKAIEIGHELKMKDNNIRSILLRWCDRKGQILEKKGAQSSAIYTKIY